MTTATRGGRVCGNKPVRADYLDHVVWDHITGLLADPQLIRTEIDKRLATARTADPVTRQRKRLDSALTKTSKAIARMIEAFGGTCSPSTSCAPAGLTCVPDRYHVRAAAAGPAGQLTNEHRNISTVRSLRINAFAFTQQQELGQPTPVRVARARRTPQIGPDPQPLRSPLVPTQNRPLLHDDHKPNQRHNTVDTEEQ